MAAPKPATARAAVNSVVRQARESTEVRNVGEPSLVVPRGGGGSFGERIVFVCQKQNNLSFRKLALRISQSRTAAIRARKGSSP